MDVNQALAHSRESLQNGGHRAYDCLRDLVAALDAARNEAVVISWADFWMDKGDMKTAQDFAAFEKADAWRIANIAAPPAALASVEPTLEMVRAASSVLSGWIDSDLSDGIALKVGRAMLAQQPAAANKENTNG